MNRYSPSIKKRVSAEGQLALTYQQTDEQLYEEWFATEKRVYAEDIATVHALLFRHVPKGERGTRVTAHGRELEQLLTYIQLGTEHPVIQAGIIAAQLPIIAPFTAGNRLTAHAVSTLFLYKHGHALRRMGAIEQVWCDDRAAYEKARASTTESKSLSAWLRFYATSAATAAKATAKTVSTASFHTDIPASFWDLSDRQKAILSILDQPDATITNKKVQSLFNVSQITASPRPFTPHGTWPPSFSRQRPLCLLHETLICSHLFPKPFANNRFLLYTRNESRYRLVLS